jgi:hypothetical protein
VTQMLRQGDAKVFKKYSQMKLQMKREALEMDWSPFLRQTVKTHFSLNGELSHGIVTQAVHAGV